MVRLSADAAPGLWRYSPWNIEEGEAAVRAADGHIVACASSDAGAQYIAKLSNFLRNHHATLARIIESEATLSADHEALVIRLGEVTVELEKARKDAGRYLEFCRQVEMDEFPTAILNDAMEMGPGVLDIHFDGAVDDAMHDSAREG